MISHVNLLQSDSSLENLLKQKLLHVSYINCVDAFLADFITCQLLDSHKQSKQHFKSESENFDLYMNKKIKKKKIK